MRDDETNEHDWNAKLERLPPAMRSPLARTAARARRMRLRALLGLRSVGPAARRAIDIAASLIALILLSPVFLVAAIAIKATSRGPILFKQERVGQWGRRFAMLKLRTMVTNAEAKKTELQAAVNGALDGVRFKIKNDPRITPVGRILRKFSIDELPQLWNVLVGDMTLIGPRPPVWREVALYDPRALRRLEVKPGLTCLWQISGRSDLSFEQQVDLDIQYIDKTQPVDEVKILVRTIPAVLSGKGAY
ncbi:MAG: sugar transferase [Polyangiaceae bacterium]|nr:sugar transferase [Polyangiaceae bacterium]